jgi:hypothetical protein
LFRAYNELPEPAWRELFGDPGRLTCTTPATSALLNVPGKPPDRVRGLWC